MSAPAFPNDSSPPPPDAPTPPWTARLPELLLALGVVVLGLVVVWEARDIRIPRTAAQVGPRVIPYLVGAGLIVVGLWLAAEVALGRTAGGGEGGEDVDLTLPTDWRCLATLAAALLAYLFLIERAGFVLASALLFFGAAYGMGSRHVPRDLAIGIVLATAVYVVFTRGLDLRLPAGVFDGMF